MLRFVKNLLEHASYLNSQRVAPKGNQSIVEAREEVNEITIILAKTVCTGPAAWYLTFHQALQKSKSFESLFANDDAPACASRGATM